ncbi:MGH1-like glycoside hydrolase domain-containing protein [Caldithrix abyssi]
MRTLSAALLLLIMIHFNSCLGQKERPILSNLSATKDSPLYTTYAAAMERSEFILDQGFHFMFYDPEKGLDFTTDKAGDWCLAFKNDTNFVYRLKDMFKPPVITLSYPDMVQYEYYPLKGVKVNVAFLVYSSRLALQDITFSNIGASAVEFTLYPFLRNDYRVFNEVGFNQEKKTITFTHEELPDSWTLAHNIPYVDKVYDFFLISDAPDQMKSFYGFKGENVDIPLQVDLQKKQKYLVWGKMMHAPDKRCTHQNPGPKMMVILNNDRSKLLTERAARWGNSDPNISPYGYFGIELGNFAGLKNGDEYTIRIFCPQSGEIALVKGKVEQLQDQSSKRQDGFFKKNDLPPMPSNFRKIVSETGSEIHLYGEQAKGMRYNVYRRDYGQDAVYKLIAQNLNRASYADKNLKDGSIYGYVVTAIDKQNRMSMPTHELTNISGSDFLADVKKAGQIKTNARDFARIVSFQKQIKLNQGEKKRIRIIRGFARDEKDRKKIYDLALSLMKEKLNQYRAANEQLFARVPPLPMEDNDLQLLYWSAFNMMRQVFLPPEGKCNYNYYVFSREPTWGWGHGGQVFHESLTMVAYALLDPHSAMDSQRIYSERQYDNGYINYRTGPYLDEIIKYNGELTTSAPWYAWQNWEVYKITQDKQFLKEMYESSKRFYNFYVSNRDKDQDGLCEWGGHAVLECVRDGLVAVWDQVGWPSNFEALDLNCMLVKEANSLAAMAAELGYQDEAQSWKEQADKRAELINKTFWDDETGFYYHVDKKDHDFTFKTKDDLKRQEIIGFLPMWAGIASEEQAAKLVKALTDTSKFWRKYGVPSLAADDPYYNPKGYWNGPVWVEWNYLIMDGLIQYGYKKIARELVERNARNMISCLKKDHNLWEFYSPDEQWGGYHKTYIWAGIINRMLLDVAGF